MGEGSLKPSSERPKRSLWQTIVDVALMDVNTIVQGGIDADTVEGLERVLLEADFGVDATLDLVEDLERAAERGKVRTGAEFRAFLGERIREILAEAGSGVRESGTDAADGTRGSGRWRLGGLLGGRDSGAAAIREALRRAPSDEGPTVVMVLGVNGTGKTTTVGKLGWHLQEAGERVLLAATDTFRAGAQEQLRQWAERIGAQFVGGQEGGDPAAVAFDAIDAARSRDASWVLVDTAGRLHTQQDLMEELRKLDRVMSRKVEGAPHERLLVVDATSGQNVVSQASRFGQALDLTGLVLAKFDSTARAGTVVAVARELGIPARLLGTGERVEDLEVFDPEAYVEKLLGSDGADGRR